MEIGRLTIETVSLVNSHINSVPNPQRSDRKQDTIQSDGSVVNSVNMTQSQFTFNLSKQNTPTFPKRKFSLIRKNLDKQSSLEDNGV